MRLNIAIFFGAVFGALGVLLFLVAFGSDYWLLATEVGRCSGEQNIENVTFHHEGFFWRCWFNGIVEENNSNIWKFWYTNQPPSKNCTHAYLSPYPFMRGAHNSTSYDSAVSLAKKVAFAYITPTPHIMEGVCGLVREGKQLACSCSCLPGFLGAGRGESLGKEAVVLSDRCRMYENEQQEEGIGSYADGAEVLIASRSLFAKGQPIQMVLSRPVSTPKAT
ncbi:transmembrane protein 182 [Carlito syrichta]|uniref:Transmembrane protein 182 n=1 Tax=Carlito syrichta TaxID=1868482 RepID=A0A1U7TSN5_CARSF|nr:transmembrane protein 182 [Carlito syrichta]